MNSTQMKTKSILGLALTLFVTQLVYSQNKKLSDIRIDGLYNSSLTNFLEEISEKHGIRILFDAGKFYDIGINKRYMNAPLETVLNQISKKHRLKYTLDAGGTIHFYQGGLLDENIHEKYTGNPTKEKFTLSGTIRDAKTGESLPGVNVRINGTLTGTITNADGFFALLEVPTDTSSIIFSYLGYDKLNVRLNPKVKLTNTSIELAQKVIELNEIVITGDREEIIQVNEKISMIKLTPAKLNLLPNLGEKDIFRSLQLLPGISGANENSAGLYIRGGTPDQALVTYDGFTVYHVDHLFGFYSAFNSNAIKDVNLYKGGFDAKFGGRVSGVAEITGKDGNQNDFNIGGDLSMLSANIFTEIPIGDRLTMLFAVRKSYKGPLYNSIFDAFGPDEPEAPQQAAGRPGFSSNSATIASFFYDLNTKMTYRPSTKDVISISVYNGKDNLDNSSELPSSALSFGNISGSTADVTEWGNTGASLKWSRQWSDKLYSNSLLSHSSYFSNRDRTSSRTITPTDGETRGINTGLLEDNNINDLSFKSDIEFKLSAKHTLEFGTQLSKIGIDYSYSQNDTVSIINRDDGANIYAFYFQDKARAFNQKLLITGGLRYTNYDVTEKNYFEPRISASYFLNKNITFKMAMGRYYQFTKRVIREDVLQGSRDFWVMADGNSLPVLRSDHFILGFSYEKNGFVFDVEGYQKELNGLSEYSLRFTADQGGITYDDSFFEGTGRTLGIDILVQKSIGNYTGWMGYTRSKTTQNFPIYQEADYAASNDVTNEFKITNLYKLGRWDFSLTWIYATGRPYTEPSGGYSIELLDGTSQDFVSVSQKNALRFPDYHRLDAGITYSWKGKQGGVNSLSTSFFNMYNRENVWYKEFEIEEDELIETNIRYLGFTPNLTLSIKLR